MVGNSHIFLTRLMMKDENKTTVEEGANLSVLISHILYGLMTKCSVKGVAPRDNLTENYHSALRYPSALQRV